MASTADRKVIAYIGDITDIESQLAKLRQLNKTVASSLGKDFAKNLKAVGKGYDKLGKVTIKKLPSDMKDLIGTTTTTSDVVKTANGEFLKLTKTTTIFGKTAKKVTTPWSKITTTVSNATESLNKFGKGTSSLIGKSSQLKTNLNSVSSINAKFANSLKSTGFATELVGKRTKEVSGNLTKLGAVVKTSDGKFLKLTETVSKTANGVQKIRRSVKDVTKDFVPASKKTENFGQSLKRLASRAALTIPVWFAMRGAVSGLFRTIKSGLTSLVEQDKAFQKTRRNLEATASSVEALKIQFADLKKETLTLSIESGKSVTELTNAFQKFATVGFDYETSLAGMIGSTKLAIVEFGDVEGTALAFARAMRVLIDTTKGAESPIKQMNEAFALTDQLWQKNAFDIDEFRGNLLKLAGTAKIAKLSIQETLTLLATVSTGGLGASGGRLLITGILKSLSNLSEVGKQLDIELNPAIDSTFEIITKIIGALGKLSSAEEAPAELLTTLKDLFRIRGTRLFATLSATHELLEENAQLVPNVKKLTKAYKDQVINVGVLGDRFKIAQKEIAKAFVTGVVGGDDFDKSLVSIVKRMEIMIGQAEALGQALNITGRVINTVFKTLNLLTDFGGDGFGHLIDEVGRASDGLLNLGFTTAQINKEFIDFDKTTVNFGKSIQKALGGGLDNKEILKVITGIQLRLNNLTIDPALNRDVLKKSLPRLEKILRKELEKMEVDIGKDHIRIRPKILDADKKQIAKLTLQNILEQAQAEGALESELIKIEQILIKKLGIEDKTIDALGRQLSLQREINKEKSVDVTVSTTAVKLFRIAEKDGKEQAKKVGDALADADIFSRVLRQGGETADILLRDFANKVEQFQVAEFIRGDIVSGKKGLRGTGITFPKEDEAFRLSPEEFARRAIQEQRKAESQFLEIKRTETGEMKTRSAIIQEMQIARMKVDLVDLPGDGLPGTLTNANLQSFQDKPIPGAITNADLLNIPKVAPGTLTNASPTAPQVSVDAPINVNVDISKLKEVTDIVEEKIAERIPTVGSKTYRAILNLLTGVQSSSI